MIYNIIYFLIFFAIISVVFWILEDKVMENMGTKMVEIDGNHYLVPDFGPKGKDPKYIKSTGSILTCESLQEITGQKVKKNRNVPGAKSVISGKPIITDCHDINNNIMVDYKSREFYTYNGPDHVNDDVYEFYNRLALDAIKKEKIYKSEYNYIEVPYTVDNCKLIGNKLNCNTDIPLAKRKELIKSYLREKILEIF